MVGLVYCVCGKSNNSGYTAMPDPDNGPWGIFQDFWVCANCMRPTRMVFEKMTDKLAPARATCIKSVIADGDGRSIITWGTEVSGEKIKTMNFRTYPRKVDMVDFEDQGRNALLTFWLALDDCIDQVRGEQADLQLVEAEKVRAKTYADVLALLMAPFYADANAVLAESMTRWKARQDDTEHESPGLAESIWDPNTRFDGTPYSRDAERKARNSGASAKPPIKFDEQKITFIKHTLENGQMSPEVLAGMFSCSVEDIKVVVDS